MNFQNRTIHPHSRFTIFTPFLFPHYPPPSFPILHPTLHPPFPSPEYSSLIPSLPFLSFPLSLFGGPPLKSARESGERLLQRVQAEPDHQMAHVVHFELNRGLLVVAILKFLSSKVNNFFILYEGLVRFFVDHRNTIFARVLTPGRWQNQRLWLHGQLKRGGCNCYSGWTDDIGWRWRVRALWS